MEQYTDDERVEDLKQWWKENGASIIAGIALAVIGIFGWQYWTSHRNATAEQASQAYDAFIEAVEKPDADQARQRGQALLADFPKSPYTALAMLRLAKLALEDGATAVANQRLEWVVENAKLDELKDVARLRLAPVLAAAGRPGDAEQRLAQVTTASLIAEREELRGDLALAANDPGKARNAYAAALAASGGSTLLQLKLDNLSPPTAESLIAAPAGPPPAARPANADARTDGPPAEADTPAPAAQRAPAPQPETAASSPASAQPEPTQALTEPAGAAGPATPPAPAVAPPAAVPAPAPAAPATGQ
ncbi:MAG: tetratricopeptide repeat protein [Candidatus Competibacteraceae bacterium]|nr:tetratricopeptide repeat protein [Candidatus Competibacteraceae bacterium]MBK8897751.1 tetratricopeptide repeat protein [Candidatus Competibacteraceae bacterium]MBK8961557.1 tetratricopeptide repeat protein [Candidatus Competibacteraceae bacterium]